MQNVVSLLSVQSPTPAPAGGIVQIPVEKIVPNPRQPRGRFEEGEMASLVESIKAYGVVQPIIVRPTPNQTFELVAGERRWRASVEADLRTIPAIVRPMSPTQSLEIAIIENIQRAQLSAIETALAYKSLLEEHGLTHEEVASRVGKDRVTITNTLRLLKLPLLIHDLIASGKISEGHARALLSLPDEKSQISLANEIVEKGLSVRTVEERVSGTKAAKTDGPTRKDERRSDWKSAEEQLVHRWGRHVRIVGKNNGRIEIKYHGVDDLTRLVRDLLR